MVPSLVDGRASGMPGKSGGNQGETVTAVEEDGEYSPPLLKSPPPGKRSTTEDTEDTEKT